MKLFKSLLLASATGLVAVSGASAADLGAKKPSPVEYVRACYNPLWGTSGGFIIPGTQTCLRVFGQARFDYGWVQQFSRSASASGWRGGMSVGLDAITPSEYGNVRAFAAIGAVYRSGNQFSGTNTRQGTAFAGNFPAATGSAGQTEINYTGFIQFAGFTMGRTASFFRTVGQPAEIIGLTWMSGPGNVTTIAYTAQLGNGFLATIALEDPTIRRFGVASRSGVASIAGNAFAAPVGAIVAPNSFAAAGFGVAPTVITGPLAASSPILNAAGYTAGNVNQIGNRMPNVIASLRVDQAWGSAELSGMLNEVGVVGNLLNEAGGRFTPGSRFGFAVNGALKINLPMLAAGSNLTLNGVYSEGNLSAVLSNGGGNLFQGINVGGLAVVTPDATVSQFGLGGGLRLTKAWGVTAGLQHFWTPTVSSAIFGSYAQVDVANVPLTLADSLRDFRLLTLGVNTVWQPVRGLNIALEGAWVRMDIQGRAYDVNKNVANVAVGGPAALLAPGATGCNIFTGVGCRVKGSDSQFQARLRVTRDF
ncbi:MAG: porin [Beijerinckiaceae bacterium]